MANNTTTTTSSGCLLIDLIQQPRYSNALTGIRILIGVDIIPTVFTIMANVILLLAIAKTRSLHTPANTLLAALCFSDLLVGVFSQPVFLALLFQIQWFQTPSKILAKVVAVSSSVLNGSSFIIVLFITIDRYIAVCHPFLYLRKASIKCYSIVVTLTFIYQFFSPIASSSFYFYSYAAFTTIAFPAIFICYVRIYSVITEKERSVLRLGRIGDEEKEELHRNKEERSKSFTIMILLAVFTITYLPILIVVLVIFGPNQNSDVCQLSPDKYVVLSWSTFIYALSGAVNPIAYCIRIKDIKKAVKNLLITGRNRVSSA